MNQCFFIFIWIYPSIIFGWSSHPESRQRQLCLTESCWCTSVCFPSALFLNRWCISKLKLFSWDISPSFCRCLSHHEIWRPCLILLTFHKKKKWFPHYKTSSYKNGCLMASNHLPGFLSVPQRKVPLTIIHQIEKVFWHFNCFLFSTLQNSWMKNLENAATHSWDNHKIKIINKHVCTLFLTRY